SANSASIRSFGLTAQRWVGRPGPCRLRDTGQSHPALTNPSSKFLCLIGVESLTKGLSTDVLAGHFVLSVRLNPPQDAPIGRVAFIEPNLPKGGSAMRPKVIPNEPYSSFNKLKFDLLWFGTAARHRPREV